MPLTINLSEAIAGLNLLAQMNMAPWLAAVGAREVKAIEKRIQITKGGPDYNPWAEWSPRRLREREAKGNVGQGLLWDTGHLLESFEYAYTPAEVTIGTDVPYAKELQEGRSDPTRMAARPFVGWTDEETGGALLFGEEQGLEASLLAFLEGVIR